MYIYTVDKSVKDTLMQNGCVLVFETTDINENSMWCFKQAPHFSFDINPQLKGKYALSETLRMTF